LSNFIYNISKQNLGSKAMDLRVSGDTFAVILVMTNTTCGSDHNSSTIGGFATLDEFVASGYTSGGITLTSQSLTQNNSQNRSEWLAANVTFTTLAAGARQAQAAVIYKSTGTFSTGIPFVYIDTGGFPFTGNGSNVTLQWNASGIVQIS
jgi:hypothetical protein